MLVAIVVSGRDITIDDPESVMDLNVQVAKYGDERLQAAATGQDLPEPPLLLADDFSLWLLVSTTLVQQVLVFGAAGAATRQTLRAFATAVGLDRYHWTWIWRPTLVMIGCYLGIALYSIAARYTGIDWLEPDSTVPDELVRSVPLGLGSFVMICIGAPLSEEAFFRGLVFSGLLRWGFWPAGAISAFLFCLVHFDPGSIIPFFGIGLAMAWLYWSRGSLWDSIIFHTLFNFTSFLLLVAGV